MSAPHGLCCAVYANAAPTIGRHPTCRWSPASTALRPLSSAAQQAGSSACARPAAMSSCSDECSIIQIFILQSSVVRRALSMGGGRRHAAAINQQLACAASSITTTSNCRRSSWRWPTPVSVVHTTWNTNGGGQQHSRQLDTGSSASTKRKWQQCMPRCFGIGESNPACQSPGRRSAPPLPPSPAACALPWPAGAARSAPPAARPGPCGSLHTRMACTYAGKGMLCV